VFFSLYVNDIPKPSRFSPVIWRPTSVDWRDGYGISINVYKSTAVLFVKTAGRIQKPRGVHFLGDKTQ
jgi:hypothetical protein